MRPRSHPTAIPRPALPAARLATWSLGVAGAIAALALAPGRAHASEVVAQAMEAPGVKTSPALRMNLKPSSPALDEAHAAQAAAASAASAAAVASRTAARREPPRPIDPMEKLRVRLAEKLGAKPAAEGGNPNVMHVSNHGESGEHVIVPPRPSPRALAAAAGHGGAPHAGADAHDAPAAPAALAPAHAAAHWDYSGEGGPDAWARLKPEYAACGSGTRQSPIDIRGGIHVDLDPVQFDYRPSGFSVIDNGHTVQVNVAPGNSIRVMGRRFDLVQFHFHRPSEERIDGRQFDMVAHLVHKDADGRLAVVAVLLDRGSAHPLVQTIWNNLPLEKGDEVAAGTSIDLARLLPEDRRYYTYMGSLTTPPCSEGVLWMVMKQPVAISPEQVAIFSRLYPMNARPIQQASGRLIKESN